MIALAEHLAAQPSDAVQVARAALNVQPRAQWPAVAVGMEGEIALALVHLIFVVFRYYDDVAPASRRKENSVKVYSALARSLKRDHGVTTVFGLLGAGTMSLADELVHQHGGNLYRVAREDGAILGAMGYQHATGELGVAALGAGPGLSNAITALVEATRNHTPMLLINDDKSYDPGNIQAIDQRELVGPTRIGYVQIDSPESAVPALARAVRMAFDEHRPVLLDLPGWIAMADVDEAATGTVELPAAGKPAIEGLDAALELIRAARRPVILAGWGALLADARADLERLAQQIGAPVATTMKAKSFFAGEPFDLGTFGGFSKPITKEVIRDSDLVIAFGAGLNLWTGDHGYLLRDRPIVQVDLRREGTDSTFPVAALVVGDAADVAREFSARLEGAEGFPRAFRSDELRDRLANLDRSISAFTTELAPGTVDLHESVGLIERVKPAGSNVITDGGRYVIAPMMHLTVEHPRRWMAPIGGFGAIGLTIGTGIGLAVGRPEVPTFVILGDGAFMMSLYELSTAARYGLDLVVVVMNDGAYGSEYTWYLNSESENPQRAADMLARFDWPDFADVARAFQFDAVTVTSPDDYAAVEAAVANRTRPLLVDVRLDPDSKMGFAD
ncbi:MAG: thiamine pyrophosphate-binding protein [Protaetiibacter sp.]